MSHRLPLHKNFYYSNIANAFSKMDENLDTKNEQAANAFSEMDEKLGTKIEPAANAFSKKE